MQFIFLFFLQIYVPKSEFVFSWHDSLPIAGELFIQLGHQTFFLNFQYYYLAGQVWCCAGWLSSPLWLLLLSVFSRSLPINCLENKCWPLGAGNIITLSSLHILPLLQQIVLRYLFTDLPLIAHLILPKYKLYLEDC